MAPKPARCGATVRNVPSREGHAGRSTTTHPLLARGGGHLGRLLLDGRRRDRVHGLHVLIRERPDDLELVHHRAGLVVGHVGELEHRVGLDLIHELVPERGREGGVQLVLAVVEDAAVLNSGSRRTRRVSDASVGGCARCEAPGVEAAIENLKFPVPRAGRGCQGLILNRELAGIAVVPEHVRLSLEVEHLG